MCWALHHSLSEKREFYSTSSAYTVAIITIYQSSLILYPVRRVACLNPCMFYCFYVKLSLNFPTHCKALQQPRDIPLWKWGARWKCQRWEGAGATGRQLRGAGRAGWQGAQPTHVSHPLHLSQEFGSFSLLPAWCGRSGAEKRTPAGRLKRKRICKGRAKGVFSSQKFPNPSILLQLYDCSPQGHFPRAHLFHCTRIIHSLPATPDRRGPVLAPPHLFQYPSPFPPCCPGDAAREMRRMSYKLTFEALALVSAR